MRPLISALLLLLCTACEQGQPEPVLLDSTVNGTFDLTSLPNAEVKYEDNYVIGLAAGQTIKVTLTSGDFDAFLRIRGPSGALAEDDDGAGNQDSQIVYTAQQSGAHIITATQYSDSTGAYTLKVDRLQTTLKPLQTNASLDDTLAASPGFHEYRLMVEPGSNLVITMTSDVLDTYLELRGPDLDIEDDDSAGDGDARLTHTFEQGGLYVLKARSYSGSDAGPYHLEVRDYSGLDPAVATALGRWSGEGPKATLALDRPHPVVADEGSLQPTGELAWTYAVTGASGRLRASLSAGQPDWTWALYSPDGEVLADAPADEPLVAETYETVLFLRLSATEGAAPGELLVTRSSATSAVPRETLRPLALDGWRTGVLSRSDLSQDEPEAHYEVWQLELEAGKAYTMEMESNEVDSYLILLDASKRPLDSDDDSGSGDRDSRLRHTTTTSGTYYLMATTAGSYETGSYKVRVTETTSGGFSGVQRPEW